MDDLSVIQLSDGDRHVIHQFKVDLYEAARRRNNVDETGPIRQLSADDRAVLPNAIEDIRKKIGVSE